MGNTLMFLRATPRFLFGFLRMIWIKLDVIHTKVAIAHRVEVLNFFVTQNDSMHEVPPAPPPPS